MLSTSSDSSPSGGTSKNGCLTLVIVLLAIGGIYGFFNPSDPSTFLNPSLLIFPLIALILFVVYRHDKKKKLVNLTANSFSEVKGKDSDSETHEFPEFDIYDRPLRDVTRVRLSGYSKTHFYNNAQEAINDAKLYDEVVVHHDEANPADEYAVYITNICGDYMGWIPNTKRYAEFKKDLCRLLRESDDPAIDARVCDLLYGDGDYVKCEVEIARYGEAPEAPQSPKKVKDPAAEIAKYKVLLDSGAITQEEYDAKKKQLLEI